MLKIIDPENPPEDMIFYEEDGVPYLCSDPGLGAELAQAFEGDRLRRMKLDSDSLYHIGEKVRLIENPLLIEARLTKGLTGFRHREARMLARCIAGSMVRVIGIDMLSDGSSWNKYYTVESEFSPMTLVTEDLVQCRI